MAKCRLCERKGLFFKVDKNGYCAECAARIAAKRAEAAKIKTERFKLSGLAHYENNIKSLCEHNDDYDMKKSELRESFEGEKVYALLFDETITLEPEPDNEYDTNAVCVKVGDVKIGYVAKSKSKRVKELYESGTITFVDAEIHGGKYKLVTEDGDLIKDDVPFFGELIIKYKPKE